VEVLADEQKATAVGFLSRVVAWFNSQGVDCRQVMSDNGSAYLSKAFVKACGALGLKHICTRPYTPPTNGKAERFIQTLCKEWAYAIPFQISDEPNACLPRYLSIYNRIRKHSALGSRSPQQRLCELLCNTTWLDTAFGYTIGLQDNFFRVLYNLTIKQCQILRIKLKHAIVI